MHVLGSFPSPLFFTVLPESVFRIQKKKYELNTGFLKEYAKKPVSKKSNKLNSFQNFLDFLKRVM